MVEKECKVKDNNITHHSEMSQPIAKTTNDYFKIEKVTRE